MSVEVFPLVVTVTVTQYGARWPRCWRVDVGGVKTAGAPVAGDWKAAARNHLVSLGFPDSVAKSLVDAALDRFEEKNEPSV